VTVAEVAAHIEHTLLRPEATPTDVREMCDEARAHGFAGVCVNPIWVAVARRSLAGSRVRVVSVVGFPLGASITAIKAAEAARAVADGADEIDMVMTLGPFRAGDDAAVRDDVAAVVAAAGDAPVKVILETASLETADIERACRLVTSTGARWVKTSTGFGSGGATVGVVRTLRAAVGERFGVKASGGIRDAATARAMIEAGADRLGTSSGVAIVEGWSENSFS